MSPRSAPPFWLLVMLTGASPFAMNALLPLMPMLAKAFATDNHVIQLTLTLALVAFGATQLVIGPVSDRIGRRPVMIAGLALFVIGSLISAMATSTFLLIAGRVIQAGGGAAGLVLSRTILHDIHGREKAAGAIAYVTMAMMIAPMIAPWFGGKLGELAGWRAVFWTMAAIGAGLFALTVVNLGETHRSLTGPARSLSGIFIDAGDLLRNRDFLGYAGAQAFTSGTFFAFLGAAPFVVIENMHRTASEYSIGLALVPCGYLIGNFITGRYSHKLGPYRMLRFSQSSIFAGIAGLWLLGTWNDPLSLFLPMAVVAVACGLALPNATAGAMGVMPKLAGSAAGISGAMQMLLAALLTTLVGYYLGNADAPIHALSMLVGITASAVISLGFFTLIKPPSQQIPSVLVAGAGAIE